MSSFGRSVELRKLAFSEGPVRDVTNDAWIKDSSKVRLADLDVRVPDFHVVSDFMWQLAFKKSHSLIFR